MQRKPGERGITIVRRDYGLVGLKDSWTKEEIAKGAIPFFIGRTTAKENELINKGETFLPKDYTETINKYLMLLPLKLRRLAVKFINRLRKK